MTYLDFEFPDSPWYLVALICFISTFYVLAFSKLFSRTQFSKGKRKELQRPLLRARETSSPTKNKSESSSSSYTTESVKCSSPRLYPDLSSSSSPNHNTRSSPTVSPNDTQELFAAKRNNSRTHSAVVESPTKPTKLRQASGIYYNNSGLISPRKQQQHNTKKSPSKHARTETTKGKATLVPQSLLGEVLSIIGPHRKYKDADKFTKSYWDVELSKDLNYSAFNESTELDSFCGDEEVQDTVKTRPGEQKKGSKVYQSEVIVLLELFGSEKPEEFVANNVNKENYKSSQTLLNLEKDHSLSVGKQKESPKSATKALHLPRSEGINVENLFMVNDSLDAGLACYHNNRIWAHDCRVGEPYAEDLLLKEYITDNSCHSSTSTPGDQHSMDEDVHRLSGNDGDVSSNVSSTENGHLGDVLGTDGRGMKKKDLGKHKRLERHRSIDVLCNRCSSDSEENILNDDEYTNLSCDNVDDVNNSDGSVKLNFGNSSPSDKGSLSLSNVCTTPKVYYKVDFNSDDSPTMEWSTRLYDEESTQQTTEKHYTNNAIVSYQNFTGSSDIEPGSLSVLTECSRTDQSRSPIETKTHSVLKGNPSEHQNTLSRNNFEVPVTAQVVDSSTDTGVQLSSGSLSSLVCEAQGSVTPNDEVRNNAQVDGSETHGNGTLLNEMDKPVGVTKPVKIIQYANAEWKGTTSKACLMRKGYSAIPVQLGLSQICRIRGDNYCALRATIFQVLYHGIDVLSSYESAAQFMKIPGELFSEGYEWLNDWRFVQTTETRNSSKKDVIEQMERILAALFNQVKVFSVIPTQQDRSSLVFQTFTLKEDVEFSILEAVKFLMLLKAIQLFKSLQAGEDVPLVAHFLFARDSSPDPKSFMKNHLNHVGVSGGLEQVEMLLLGHALGVTLKVVRVSQADKEDFITLYPDDLPPGNPVVTLVAEDDRHYNVLLE